MKKLIVNADDFGRHELINSAVRDAFTSGICRSTSLMAGGEAFDDAVRISRELPNLDVGIHFTLVMGKPVLPPEEIPTLVDKNGNFHADFSVFVRKYFSGGISMTELRSELSAQLRKIQSAWVRVSHVDSHQHIHTLNGISGVVFDLAESAGIRGVRMPRVPGLSCSLGRMSLKILAAKRKIAAEKRGFFVPDNFRGIVAGNAVSEDWLCRMIDSLPEGVTELMIHPGSDNSVLQKFTGWSHDFEAELNAAKSKRVIEALGRNEIEITSFMEMINS